MQRVQQRAQRLLAVVLAAVAQLGAQRQRREAAQQVDRVGHAVVVAGAQLRRARDTAVSSLSKFSARRGRSAIVTEMSGHHQSTSHAVALLSQAPDNRPYRHLPMG